jgi:phage gp36-like protein
MPMRIDSQMLVTAAAAADARLMGRYILSCAPVLVVLICR